MQTIKATDFLDSRRDIVESAAILADALVERINQGGGVEISLAGLKGIPSIYFNVVLLRLAEAFGPEVLENQVKFQFSSESQRYVFERSLDAVRKSLIQKT